MHGMRKSPITNGSASLAALLMVCSLSQISQGQNTPSISGESTPIEEVLPKPTGIRRLPPVDGQQLEGVATEEYCPPDAKPEGVAIEEYCPPGPMLGVACPEAEPKGIPPSILEEALKALDLEASLPPPMEPNLGTERVIFAPFEIDVAYPQNVTSFRFDTAFGMGYPDRSEYFWKKVDNATGPILTRNDVDFQEVRVYSEHAAGDSSAFIELPIRFVQTPGERSNTGLGDLQIGVKSLLSKGDGFYLIPTPGNSTDSWRVCGILTNYIRFSSSLAERGLSTGHFSLEPGLLATYSMSKYTIFSNELKYWIPLGGTRGFAGNVLRWGMGASHVIFFSSPEVDSRLHFAIIPTIELIGWDFRNGGQTKIVGGNPEQKPVNRISVINVQPGVRVPLGKHFEIGISSSTKLTGQGVYDDLYRIDFRWLR